MFLSSWPPSPIPSGRHSSEAVLFVPSAISHWSELPIDYPNIKTGVSHNLAYNLLTRYGSFLIAGSPILALFLRGRLLTAQLSPRAVKCR